jgi:predicted ATPase
MTGAGLDAAAVTDGVANLIAKSLIMQDQSESGNRWYLLETIRAYAYEKLAAHDEAAIVARYQAEYFRDLASSARLGSRVSDEDDLSLPRIGGHLC